MCLDVARFPFVKPRIRYAVIDALDTSWDIRNHCLAAITCMPFDLVSEIAQMATPLEWSTRFVFEKMAEMMAEQDGGEGTSSKQLFSLHAMRQRRITTLPSRFARKDADDIVAQLEFPSRETIDDAFSNEGVLGSIYDDYEPRSEQREMAMAIRDSFEAGENVVVEAGTGVGKSMAYLVPAVLTAKANGIAIGVSTKTNSLLDQLVYSELPSLAEAYSQLYPEADPIDNGPSMKEIAGQSVTQAPSLAALLSYIEQSEFDDMDSLKIDYRVLPRYSITTKSHECLRRKCPFFGKLCFVHGARRRAETADVIVTNHTLLFCDLAADGGLLPTVRHWIIDEAHSAENEARVAFSEAVDSEAIARIAGRVSTAGGSRNVFTRAERSVENADGEQLTVFFALSSKAREAGEGFAQAVDDYNTHVKDLLYFDPTRKSSGYEKVDIWINEDVRKTQVFSDVRLVARSLVEAADKLIKASQDLVAYLEGIDEAAVAQREIASVAMELRDVRNAAELIFEMAPENYAYQATLNRKKDKQNDVVAALLLDVGEKMNETLYVRTHSVAFASATLSIAGKFDSFESAVGLNRGEFSQAREFLLDSHFDFDNNMVIYVVKDMPEPNDRNYLSALESMLVKLHRAQKGSMLTLFTNRREMEQCYDFVKPQLKGDDLRIVCQKWGVSVKGLRDEFLADEHLSLFALKSFWEGFDAPGSTLKGVVIPKLPFARPTDPLYCERAARDDRAWWRYVLPQAVIETKQAAGRLIRKADDHGVLVLADKRLLTKSYGKTFLGSLQSKTVRVCTVDEIATALQLMNR